MSPRAPADLAAREAAQTVFDRPVLLEAGAGTGKTTTLVARVLAWCLGPGWERTRRTLERDGDEALNEEMIAAETLQGVVAITFTEAAAAEMAERLAASLAQIVDGSEGSVVGFDPTLLRGVDGSEERRRRAIRLLEAFDYLTVGTIHSFCYGLLRNYPLEAGLHPELRVDADGRELEGVARTVVEQWSQQAYTSGSHTPFLTLAERRIGPSELLEAVVQWYAEGPSIEVLEEDPLGPETIADLLRGLSRTTVALLEMVGESLADLPAGRVARRVQASVIATAELLTTSPPDTMEGLGVHLERLRSTWAENDIDRLQKWSRADFTGEEEARLGPLGEPFARACDEFVADVRAATGLEPELLGAAREAMLPLLRQVDQEMRTRGAITFSGLLQQTLELLRRSPGVAEREQRRIRALLVDEFQDTDPRQSSIVRRLGLEGPEESRPSLFVVGDPKQSIYAWRDADLAAYEAFGRALREAGGESYSLEVNFRSTQAILDEVERAIEPVMHYQEGVQPDFRGLRAAGASDRSGSGALKTEWSPVEYWVSWSSDPGSGRLGPGPIAETAELEAYELANDIRRLRRSTGIAWNRIGILFRKSTSQPPFLDELRRQEIPFAVTRDRNYYQRREVIEAAAWVRAILNPTDHLALLTVLRSSVVGVPDAALLPLWRLSFPQLATELTRSGAVELDRIRELLADATEAIPDDIPGLERLAGWQESLVAALASLARLRESYRRDPADRFVRRMRGELLTEVSEAARFQGKFRLANLQRFFRQLETAMQSEEADVHAILRALRLGVSQALEAEEAMPRDAAEQAVQVMTIHTAKGLEFDHVYLPQLHAQTRRGGSERASAAEVAPGVWEYQLFGAQTPGFATAERRRERIEAAEMVRTLYVAMTRACQRLVLAGRWPKAIDPENPVEARDYIDLLEHRRDLPASLEEPANDPQAQLMGHWDDGTVRWRFLGTAGRHRAPRSLPPPNPWLPSSSTLEQIAKRHRQRSEEAAERMARSWSDPVTSETSERLEQVASTLTVELEESADTSLARSTAMASGTAVHNCLEHWRLDAEPAAELERQLERLSALLESPDEIERAGETLRRFASGPLLGRLRTLEPHLIGREVPVLLRSSEDSSGAPVAGYVGAIDLLYRDPEHDRVVVVDFKTDRVDGAEAITARASAYQSQEQRYARAVAEMLELTSPPTTELWFLWPGQIHLSEVAGEQPEEP